MRAAMSAAPQIKACCKTGISAKTYYDCHKKFGNVGRLQLSEIKALNEEIAPMDQRPAMR